MAKIIRMLVHSAVQVNSGMRIRVMPGARRFQIVVTKLMPVSIEPRPDSDTDQIQ